ncbi:hypothetical protein BU25DRAFT_190363 [Macroventuria anomochaeta]|uniref:Uncharacterized protein n=1 Tax=Macroventuria anomochaeta TaxID=301207 RepID=A0ACB6SB67_9PLEO|nr:uncharacterized protein BU25DRAFT_190363 [Macroventuria anomochaeta]KAF2631530.1 hypothetical protein BU25DRAFT_190363 [Macroventuria anomochaeta]
MSTPATCGRRSLLILVDARAKNAPCKFALSDHELGPLIKLQADLLESTKYTMGVINDQYRMIKEWDSGEAAAQAMATGDVAHPDHGLHILALQAGMYRFLKDCMLGIISEKFEALLRGSLQADTTGEVLVIIPHQCPYTVGYSSLEAIVRESQYRAPTLRYIDRLEALVSACKSEAEDHIWMLREYPSYFAETVNEHKEHRPELLSGVRCG